MKRLIVDAAMCAGCRFCEMVCSFRHEGRFSPSLSRVTVIKEDEFGMDYPVFCRQCHICQPVESCPTGALKTDGIIMLDEEACTGCGICIEACIYNAIKMDESTKPLICDLCGGEPVCAERCPTEAITFEEAEVFSETPEDAFRELRERWSIGD